MAEKGSGKDKGKTAAKGPAKGTAKGAAKGADKKAAKAAVQPAAKGAEKASAPPAPKGTPRLMEFYRDECVPQMMQEFRYKSPMQVPRLKRSWSTSGWGGHPEHQAVGVGFDGTDGRHRPKAGGDPGQEVHRRLQAAGRYAIGCMVTLRRSRMYYFLDKLMNVVLPRVAGLPGREREGV